MSDHTCPWYRRWWHRRLRRLDRRFILPALSKAAQKTHSVDPVTLTLSAWESFKSSAGQEHWRCPCATAEKR